MNFPRKLHDLLSQSVAKGHASIVSWSPIGDSFCIHNRDDFVKDVLPLWFKQKKWNSFQRQLNIYRFHSLRKDGYKDYYYHKFFVRDSMHLLYNIERVPLVGKTARVQQARSIPNLVKNESSDPKIKYHGNKDDSQSNCFSVMELHGLSKEIDDDALNGNSLNNRKQQNEAWSEVQSHLENFENCRNGFLKEQNNDRTILYNSNGNAFGCHHFENHNYQDIVKDDLESCSIRKLSMNFANKTFASSQAHLMCQNNMDYLKERDIYESFFSNNQSRIWNSIFDQNNQQLEVKRLQNIQEALSVHDILNTIGLQRPFYGLNQLARSCFS